MSIMASDCDERHIWNATVLTFACTSPGASWKLPVPEDSDRTLAEPVTPEAPLALSSRALCAADMELRTQKLQAAPPPKLECQSQRWLFSQATVCLCQQEPTTLKS